MITRLKSVFDASGTKGIQYFHHLLEHAGIENRKEIAFIAKQTIAHVTSGAKSRRESEKLIALQVRWYNSLRVKGRPDYSVYDAPEYIGDLWACWSVYSRKYLREIRKPRAGFPRGIAAALPQTGLVVDLGNGLGASTAALKEIFPRARVVGTNVPNSAQWKVAEGMAAAYGFEMFTDPKQIGSFANLVFASEYFEHFDSPIEHLNHVLKSLQPRALLLANSFTQDAIGHFDFYRTGAGEKTDGRATSRAFSKRLEEAGYRKQKTGVWNNRPALWLKA